MNQDRRAQHDAQLYHCIKSSLTPEAERKILAERNVYHINGIKSKKMEHNEGATRLTPEQLMTLALNKYSLLNKQNMWNVKSAEEERVLALQNQGTEAIGCKSQISKVPGEQEGKGKQRGEGQVEARQR